MLHGLQFWLGHWYNGILFAGVRVNIQARGSLRRARLVAHGYHLPAWSSPGAPWVTLVFWHKVRVGRLSGHHIRLHRLLFGPWGFQGGFRLLGVVVAGFLPVDIPAGSMVLRVSLHTICQIEWKLEDRHGVSRPLRVMGSTTLPPLSIYITNLS